MVTTLWTLWASTYGPLQTSEGILAQLMMTLYTYYKFAPTEPPSDSLSPLSPYLSIFLIVGGGGGATRKGHPVDVQNYLSEGFFEYQLEAIGVMNRS